MASSALEIRCGEAQHPGSEGGDLPLFHRRGAPQIDRVHPNGFWRSVKYQGDSGNQPRFRTRDCTVTIWLHIIGEREVDGVCRAVFALHEQMDHGAGLAPEEVADVAQRERRGFVDRHDHVPFR